MTCRVLCWLTTCLEGNRELLVEVFRRHPAASAPISMQYGFWTNTRPVFWYICKVGLRRAVCRAYRTPLHEDMAFLEQSWMEWGEKAKIEEKSAGVLYEAQRIRICNSGTCPLGRTLQDHPLLICRGCGEARYCDKVCQKRSALSKPGTCTRVKLTCFH